MTVSTEGTAPQRQYVIRYNVCSSRLAGLLNPPKTLFDVVLSEGEPGGIEFRYYSVPAIASQYVAIGIHGNADLTQYTQLQYGYIQLTSAMASQLTGATASFEYTGQSALSGCSAFGANFSSVSQADLVFTNAAANYTIYARPCGEVAAPACSANPATAFASVCQVSSAGPVVLSEYVPSAVAYSATPAGLGVRQSLSDGAYCSVSGGSYAPRITQTDYLCVQGNSTTALLNVVENPPCTFTLSIQTPAACMASTACIAQVGDQYNWQLCPYVVPALGQTSPQFVFNGASAVADNVVVRVALPFAFHMYGVAYDYVWVSTDGLLQVSI